jgi:hypothetical protein
MRKSDCIGLLSGLDWVGLAYVILEKNTTIFRRSQFKKINENLCGKVLGIGLLLGWIGLVWPM